MQIAELVPEVSFAQRFAIGDAQVFDACQRLQHEEMAGLRFVQASQQPVDGMDAALRRNDEIRPAFARMDGSFRVGHRLQRTHNGCADRDDPFTVGVCGIHQTSGFRRDTIIFVVGRLVIFQAGDAGMEDQRRNLHAVCDQLE